MSTQRVNTRKVFHQFLLVWFREKYLPSVFILVGEKLYKYSDDRPQPDSIVHVPHTFVWQYILCMVPMYIGGLVYLYQMML